MPPELLKPFTDPLSLPPLHPESALIANAENKTSPVFLITNHSSLKIEARVY
jgi:hypothetical protein